MAAICAEVMPDIAIMHWIHARCLAYKGLMQIAIIERFGGIDEIKLADQPVPEPGPGQVRLAVRAAALNPLDWKIRGGHMKIMSGSRFPMSLGSDVAGVVEAVGAGVSGLAPGTAVFGTTLKGRGAFAEKALALPAALVEKPAGVSFAEAAAVPVVGFAALTAIGPLGRVAAGQRVLINGCTGGFGLTAIQYARAAGAHLTGTTSGRGLALARELGVDEVVDFKAEDIVARGGTYDLLLELSGRLPFARARALLTARGRFIDPAPSVALILGSKVANLFRRQKLEVLLSASSPAMLSRLRGDLAAGRLRPVVDRSFALAEVREAFRYAEAGGVVGKVVLTIP
jgi:NADPH:quinone reductase-like Zn-dependent oxidoreductase